MLYETYFVAFGGGCGGYIDYLLGAKQEEE